MKKLLTIITLAITAMTMMADEFKIGKFTFAIESPTTVGLIDADEDIGNVFLSETIDYKGNSYTLTYIGWEAFSGCESLTSVTIPNSVTSIGWEAFSDCSALTSITIPNSVTSIGGVTFEGTALYENPANWENGALYIDNCLIKVDSGFVGHFRIKENTRVIADEAFSDCESLTSVTIPNGVTSIGNYAFYYCSSLTSVTIPNSVTSIGWKAFWRTALYNDPANWENGALYINNCLIKVDKGFAGHFRIKENTRVIAGGAFWGCKSLTSVTIPNSVTSIGKGAFACCTSLTSVTIPNSVTSIGWGAFGATALYETPANWENGALYIDDCLIKVAEDFVGHFRIKENTRVIAKYAFDGCSSLTSVTIPNSVTSIGEGAFYYCSSLTSVSIPNSVTSIEDEAFYYCSSLTSVTIPNSVTSIGRYAFPEHTQIIRQ